LIASSTDTHADLVEAAARAGKVIFCEKPLDLDRRRAEACAAVNVVIKLAQLWR
jgi:myo-inositol 2-dehydrogenase / D-chiro-inositol 1-dehydrogenase